MARPATQRPLARAATEPAPVGCRDGPGAAPGAAPLAARPAEGKVVAVSEEPIEAGPYALLLLLVVVLLLLLLLLPLLLLLLLLLLRGALHEWLGCR